MVDDHGLGRAEYLSRSTKTLLWSSDSFYDAEKSANHANKAVF